VGITKIAVMEDMVALGIPSRQQLVQPYCRDSNLTSPPVTATFATFWEWSGFYLAFLFFKICVNVQGVSQHAATGVASSAVADQVAQVLPSILDLTRRIMASRPPPPLVLDDSTKTAMTLSGF
jgi:hypothetical protein